METPYECLWFEVPDRCEFIDITTRIQELFSRSITQVPNPGIAGTREDEVPSL
jgi:hypothetical protein